MDVNPADADNFVKGTFQYDPATSGSPGTSAGAPDPATPDPAKPDPATTPQAAAPAADPAGTTTLTSATVPAPPGPVSAQTAAPPVQPDLSFTQNVPPPAAAPGAMNDDQRLACDKFLTDHRFKATKSEEIVPGDMSCDVSLDGHTVMQSEVTKALLAAFPALSSDPVALSQYVSERWDLEIKQALLLSVNLPPTGSDIRSPPDGLLKRSTDGQTYWSPAPLITIGGMPDPVVGKEWIQSYLDYYDIGAPQDGQGGNGACHFNGAASTIAEVVATLNDQATLAGYKPDGASATSIATGIVAHRTGSKQTGDQVADQAKAVGDYKAPNEGPQIVTSIAGQCSGHWNLTRSSQPAKPDGTIQFQFALNDVSHPNNTVGPEFQGALTVQYNVITKQWQVLGGGQFVYVMAVWDKVQIQLVAGLAAGAAADLADHAAANGVFQLQLGPQVTVTLGPVQLSLLVSGGSTVSSSAPTLDAGYFTIQAAMPQDLTHHADPPKLDLTKLKTMPMADLLDVFAEVGTRGQLKNIPGDQGPRINMAVAAVEGDFKDPSKSKSFYAALDGMVGADNDAIRAYVYAHIDGSGPTPP